jgi:hypothetical protein
MYMLDIGRPEEICVERDWKKTKQESIRELRFSWW